MRVLILLTLSAGLALAQSGRNVVLTWPASPTPNVTYNIYERSGACSGSGSYTKVNTTPVNGLSFTRQNIALGLWCFYVTAFGNNLESVPSPNSGDVTSAPAPPGKPSVTFEVALMMAPDGTIQAKMRLLRDGQEVQTGEVGAGQ